MAVGRLRAADPNHGLAAPLTGRADELEVVRGTLNAARALRAAVLLVEGEAGIGKTRLVREALDSVPSFATTLYGSAGLMGRTRPFGAIADALGINAGSADPDRRRIARLLHESSETSRELRGDSGEAALRIEEAILTLLEQLAQCGPLVLILEDLHWADHGTLATLDAATRRLAGLPVAIVGTARPGRLGRELDGVTDGVLRRGGSLLTLRPLTDEAVAELATALAGAAPGERLRGVLAGAHGNPFFVIELLRALQSDDGIAYRQGTADVESAGLPDSLRLVLLHQIGRLGHDAVQLLRVAAVLGHTFEVDDLALVTGRPVIALVSEVQPLVRAGVLEDAGPRALAFRHALLREAIYTDLAPAVRGALHREIARCLSTTASCALKVAEHLLVGATKGDQDAAGWLQRAAREAHGRSPAIAAELARRALTIVEPDDRLYAPLIADFTDVVLWGADYRECMSLVRSALAGEPPDPEIEALLRLHLVEALILAGDVEGAAAVNDEARTRPALDWIRRRQVLYDGYIHTFRGQITQAVEACRLAVDESIRVDDAVTAGRSLDLLSALMHAGGQMGEADRLAHESVAWGRRGGVAGAHWPSLRTLAEVLLDLDRVTEAEEALAEGRENCRRYDIRCPRPLYSWTGGRLHFQAGRWDEAVGEIEDGLRLADETGLRLDRLLARGLLARIAVHRNQLERAAQALAPEPWIGGGQEQVLLARALLHEAQGEQEQALVVLAGAPATGLPVAAWAVLGPDLVRLALAAGERELAGDAAARVAQAAESIGAAWTRAAALLSRGLIAADATLVLDAVTLLEATNRPLELGRTREQAGVLLVATGREDEARQLLTQAADSFTALGASWDLGRVTAMLRARGWHRGRRSRRTTVQTGWASLTRTEGEVVRLLAEGLSNPQIGARLFISPRTVETHLSHVFAKLGVRSRGELTALAARSRQEVPADDALSFR